MTRVTDKDIEDMLDNAITYDSKPLDNHDHKLIKGYLEDLLQQK